MGNGDGSIFNLLNGKQKNRTVPIIILNAMLIHGMIIQGDPQGEAIMVL